MPLIRRTNTSKQRSRQFQTPDLIGPQRSFIARYKPCSLVAPAVTRKSVLASKMPITEIKIDNGFQRGTHARWQLVANDRVGAPTLTDMEASFTFATRCADTAHPSTAHWQLGLGAGSRQSFGRGLSAGDHNRPANQHAVSVVAPIPAGKFRCFPNATPLGCIQVILYTSARL